MDGGHGSWAPAPRWRDPGPDTSQHPLEDLGQAGEGSALFLGLGGLLPQTRPLAGHQLGDSGAARSAFAALSGLGDGPGLGGELDGGHHEIPGAPHHHGQL